MKNMDDFIDQAEQSLQAIERAFGVSITLHDMRGTISHPACKVILRHRHHHRHPCCLYKRHVFQEWDKRCFNDCFTKSEKQAVKSKGFFLKACWKGLGELVTPVIHDQHHVLTLYTGVFRLPDSEFPETIPKDREFRDMLETLAPFDEEKLLELNSLLTFWGHGLLHFITQDQQSNDTTRGTIIKQFINANAHLPITIKDLAKYLHLSPSRAGHTVREYTGMTFQELLLKERMLRAKNLLLQSPQTLDDIAENLGFTSSYYFNRVFSKFYGMPPGKFRKVNSE